MPEVEEDQAKKTAEMKKRISETLNMSSSNASSSKLAKNVTNLTSDSLQRKRDEAAIKKTQ